MRWQSLEDPEFISRTLVSNMQVKSLLSKKFCKITEEFVIASSFSSSYLCVISHWECWRWWLLFRLLIQWRKKFSSVSFRPFLIINDPMSTNTKTLNFYFFFNQVPVFFAHTMSVILVNCLCPVSCQTSGARRSWGRASVLSFSKFIVIFMPIVVYVYTSHIFILLVVSCFWSKQSVPNFHGSYGESGVWKRVQNRVFFSLLLNY